MAPHPGFTVCSRLRGYGSRRRIAYTHSTSGSSTSFAIFCEARTPRYVATTSRRRHLWHSNPYAQRCWPVSWNARLGSRRRHSLRSLWILCSATLSLLILASAPRCGNHPRQAEKALGVHGGRDGSGPLFIGQAVSSRRHDDGGRPRRPLTRDSAMSLADQEPRVQKPPPKVTDCIPRPRVCTPRL